MHAYHAVTMLFQALARTSEVYLGGRPVCHSVSGHEVGLRMEGKLSESEPRLRRRMALCVRPKRLHHVDRILHHTRMLREALLPAMHVLTQEPAVSGA